MNSLPKTVTRQCRDCDLNPGPSAPESSMLTVSCRLELSATGPPLAWGNVAEMTYFELSESIKSLLLPGLVDFDAEGASGLAAAADCTHRAGHVDTSTQ